MYIYIYIYMCVCVCVCVCVYVWCVSMYVWLYACISIYSYNIYVYIYIFVYIYCTCIPPLGVGLRAVQFLKASVDVADADIVEHEKRPKRGPELRHGCVPHQHGLIVLPEKDCNHRLREEEKAGDRSPGYGLQ